MELTLDKETFPERTISVIPPTMLNRNQFAQYVDKAEQQYVYEGGVRITQLDAAVVTVQRQPPKKSQYYSAPDNSFTQEQIERNPGQSVYDLLRRIPGVQVVPATYDSTYKASMNVYISSAAYSIGGPVPPLLIVDDVYTDLTILEMINVHDIAQIDVLKNIGKTAIFVTNGSGGVIVIHTKDGSGASKTVTPSLHIKDIVPLGYQHPVEFYAPKYETEAQRNNPKPDLRTTIHWQPIVHIDDRGIALFEFYTADEPTSYTVIIEGVSNDGTVICQTKKINNF
jgi:hypothetical protein